MQRTWRPIHLSSTSGSLFHFSKNSFRAVSRSFPVKQSLQGHVSAPH